jgi:putative acetyltransferase
MIIRKYRPSDCPIMAKLFYDTVHTVNAKDYTEEQINAWATGNVDLDEWNQSFTGHYTLVAEINGEIAGFADMDDKGYLDKLYVHKDFQRRGIATALVKELERNAQKAGVHTFITYASITAKPFFEKIGYTVKAENQVVRNGVILVNYKMVKAVNR